MKTKALYTVCLLAVFSLYSCIETTLTNIIHADGSITRRIILKDNEDKTFPNYSMPVPYDSTWTVSDTFEIGENNDTTWVRTIEKHFLNVDEINKTYAADSGSNREFKREAKFEKKFHWFNTVYEYSENIDQILTHGIPIEQSLSKKELEYFYLPDNIMEERLKGSDSTSLKLFADSTQEKADEWVMKNLISEWKAEFFTLASVKGKDTQLKEFFKNKDVEILERLKVIVDDSTVTNTDDKITLWLNEVMGSSMYLENKAEADSAVKIVEAKVDKAMSFSEYSVKASMPGKMLATNGFIDEKAEILWPLKMEYFLASPYSMYAESKISNTWAWVLSGLFLLFVLTGLMVRVLRKRRE